MAEDHGFDGGDQVPKTRPASGAQWPLEAMPPEPRNDHEEGAGPGGGDLESAGAGPPAGQEFFGAASPGDPGVRESALENPLDGPRWSQAWHASGVVDGPEDPTATPLSGHAVGESAPKPPAADEPPPVGDTAVGGEAGGGEAGGDDAPVPAEVPGDQLDTDPEISSWISEPAQWDQAWHPTDERKAPSDDSAGAADQSSAVGAAGPSGAETGFARDRSPVEAGGNFAAASAEAGPAEPAAVPMPESEYPPPDRLASHLLETGEMRFSAVQADRPDLDRSGSARESGSWIGRGRPDRQPQAVHGITGWSVAVAAVAMVFALIYANVSSFTNVSNSSPSRNAATPGVAAPSQIPARLGGGSGGAASGSPGGFGASGSGNGGQNGYQGRGDRSAQEWVPADRFPLVRLAGSTRVLRLNQSAGGDPLTVSGREFDHGLGVAAPSKIQVSLNQQCSRFRAGIGVDDSAAPRTLVSFRVFADGQLMYHSPLLHRGDFLRPVDVPVAGANHLTLLVSSFGTRRHDRADWTDAEFECSGQDSPDGQG